MTRPPALAAVLAALLAAAACGRGGAPRLEVRPAPDYLEAGLDELVIRANAWTAATVRIRGQLRMWASGTPESRHVDAGIIASRSGAIRVQGSRSMVGNLFDLAADGARMWLRIPSRDTVYHGAAHAPAELDPERPYLALRPHHLTEALLPEPLPTRRTAGDRLLLETFPGHYALGRLERRDDGGWRLRQRVWIERLALRVARLQLFDDEGRLTLEAEYGDYDAAGRAAYPGRILVELPFERLVVRVDVERVERGVRAPPGSFVLVPAAGDRLVPIEQALAEEEVEREERAADEEQGEDR